MKIDVAKRLEGVGEYYFSKKLREIEELRASGREIISLGVGSPDQPPHPSVIAKLTEEASKPHTHSYQSYQGAVILREAFSRWYKRCYAVELNPANQILPLIGSKEGIMHVCMTYLNPGDEVLIPNPGYPTYRSAVSISGGVCVDYRLLECNGWMPNFAEIERRDLSKVKMMIVNFPHMPTGTLPTGDLFVRLVDFAKRRNILLLHDNPYSFVRNNHPQSLLSTPGAFDVALELNSLSKSHNMAGWRMGMIGGSAERISEVLRFKSNMDSGMFLPMQAAAATALDLGEEWYAELNGTYRRREKIGYEIMDAIGCSYTPDQAGLFIWGRLPEGMGDCYQFSDHILHTCGVFITPGGIFGSEGNQYIRISLCATEETLQKTLELIKKTL